LKRLIVDEEVLSARVIPFGVVQVMVFWGYHQTMVVEEVVLRDVLVAWLMTVVLLRGNHLANQVT
jgi:hypothetical protein